MPEINNAIKESQRALSDFIWPVIEDDLGGGPIDPVEGVTDNEIAKKLDMFAGIDVLHWMQDGVRGLASRVQWFETYPSDPRSWPPNTFTIRRSTPRGNDVEYQRRLKAIQNECGLLFPHFMIHAYMQRRGQPEIDSIGVVKTKDLITYIRPEHTVWKPVKGGNTMFVVPWNVLERAGIEVMVWQNIFGKLLRCDKRRN